MKGNGSGGKREISVPPLPARKDLFKNTLFRDVLLYHNFHALLVMLGKNIVR